MTPPGSDISDKITAMLSQKEMLIAQGLQKAMKAYQENPSAQNLRDIKAAEAELAAIALEKPQPVATTPDISADLAAEETRLLKHRDDALELAKRKPTSSHIKALKKAEAALTAFRAARQEASGEQTFDTLMDVVTHLDADGWKISKSSAYEHKDDGKIRPGGNGKYTLSAVTEYARQHLQRKDGGSAAAVNLQEQKLTEEIRRISSDADMRDLKYRKEQGELIPREHVEIELAARAGDLKTHLDASARSSSTRIIKLVGGDIQKAPELISFMLGINRQVMDNYSRPIQGPDEEEE